MKKIVKKMSLALALVTCTTMTFAVAPKIDVMAAGTSSCTVQTNYLQIPGFKNKGNVGDEYKFAKFDLFDTAVSGTVALTVKDPYGRVLEGFDAKAIAASDEPTFTPSMSGTYVATYAVTANGIATKTDFDIEISYVSADVSLSLPANSADIVPSKVSTKKADGTATTIKFPTAILEDGKGNIVNPTDAGITVSILTPTVNKSGVNVNWNSATSTLTIDKDNIGTGESAVYKVKYEAKKGNKIVASKVVEITAQEGYVAPSYKYSYDASKPTTADIGVEKILPGVEATTDNDESVSVYYEIQVEHNGTTYKATDANAKVLKINEKGQYVFTANDEGKFVVKYTIKDFTGKAPTTQTTSYTISDVKDRTAPKPLVTLPYEITEIPELDALEALQDVQMDTDIVILPIYATDDANGFVEDNLTIYRQIVDSTNSQVLFDESKFGEGTGTQNKALVFNPSPTLSPKTVWINGEEKTIATNQMQKVEEYEDNALSLQPGKYIVKYVAKDKLSGTQAVNSNYSFEVVASSAYNPGTAAPKVSFATATALPSSTYAGEEIKFNAPTAVQETVGNFSDSRLTTFVAYQLFDGTDWTTPVRYDSADSWISLNEKQTEYTLQIPEDLGAYTAIKVIAKSTNDAGNTGEAVKEIKFIGTGDEQATTITSVDVTNSQTGKVGENTTLPTVKYADDMVRYVNVDVLIESEDGTEYYAQNLVYSYDYTNGTVEVKDAYFVPETEGSYKVTYISTDANNNKTVVVFDLEVAANEAFFEAHFINAPATINGGNAEVGERVDLPAIEAYVSTEVLAADPYKLVVEGPAGYETDSETFIKFNKVGDYTIQFVTDVKYAEAFNGNAIGDLFETIKTKKYTVTVKDTKGPQVANIQEMEDAFYQINKEGSIQKGSTLKAPSIPLPEASDIDLANSTLAVTSGGITYDTFKLDADGIKRLTDTGVTFTKDGVYKFIYTLKDANGNSTLLDTYTIDVGDVEPPVLEVKEGVVSKTYAKTATVKVDMSKITAEDNIDGEELIYKANDNKYKLKTSTGTLKITVKNTTTAETFTSTVNYDRNNLAFEFNNLTAGEYVLQVSLTDSSSKEATNSDIKFTVTDTAATAVTGEEILGVVLIVVSVLMLGGVVTYFVVTRKKYKNY